MDVFAPSYISGAGMLGCRGALRLVIVVFTFLGIWSRDYWAAGQVSVHVYEYG